MRHRRVGMVLLLGVFAFASSAAAQTPPPDVNNPRAVSFTPSTDHALIDSYELDIVSPTGTVIQTLNIGKPTPDAANTCEATINVQPIAFGVGYTVRARAKAGPALSEDAVSENKFNRVPGPPSRVINKGPVEDDQS